MIALLAQSNGTGNSGGASGILFGLAAVLTALGAIVLGVLNARAVREAQRKGAEERAKLATTTAIGLAEVKTTATLAGAAAEIAVKKADEHAVAAGVVEDFRRTVEHLTGQLVDISTSTSEQLKASTDALVACERREADQAAQNAAFRSEIGELRGDVATLQRIIVEQGDGLVRGPEGPGSS